MRGQVGGDPLIWPFVVSRFIAVGAPSSPSAPPARRPFLSSLPLPAEPSRPPCALVPSGTKAPCAGSGSRVAGAKRAGSNSVGFSGGPGVYAEAEFAGFGGMFVLLSLPWDGAVSRAGVPPLPRSGSGKGPGRNRRVSW
ncbi:hypothetical protein GCM10009863_67490 [Streptomyces axinellae]|uniref:Uncharacterized protein n=1 Tax=Streptomyces axinellae TaxID=552788 RepID=A0ABP6DDM9_9ACTN